MVTAWPGAVDILDEPTNDVDPLRRRLLWDEVRRLAENGAAVGPVTHNVLEAEKAVDRLALIDQGRLLAEGTPSSFKADSRDHIRLQVMLRPGAGDPATPAFVARSARTGHNLVAVIDEADGGPAIGWTKTLIQAGAAEEYALGAITLEDAYIKLTGQASLDGLARAS
jgi:ABC-2 type transport system ATP-binding protein